MIKSHKIGIIASLALIGGAAIAWLHPIKPAPIAEQELHLAKMVASATESALTASVLGSSQSYCWRKVSGTLGDVETPIRRKNEAEMRRYMNDQQYRDIMRVSFKYLDMKFTKQGMTMFKQVPDERNKTPERILVPYCQSVQKAKL